jgi:hypothetical protein
MIGLGWGLRRPATNTPHGELPWVFAPPGLRRQPRRAYTVQVPGRPPAPGRPCILENGGAGNPRCARGLSPPAGRALISRWRPGGRAMAATPDRPRNCGARVRGAVGRYLRLGRESSRSWRLSENRNWRALLRQRRAKFRRRRSAALRKQTHAQEFSDSLWRPRRASRVRAHGRHEVGST